MIIDMLKSVSEMLALQKEQTEDSRDSQVKCAKLMLDGIIKGLEKEGEQALGLKSLTTRVKIPTSQAKPQPQPEPEPEFRCTRDANGNFSIIGTPPEDTMIELDGVKYHWKEAIGKPFKKGKIL